MKSLKNYFGNNYEYSSKSEILLDVKALIIAESLTGGEIDALIKAYEYFPMESGDTPSKSGLDSLREKEIIQTVSCSKSDYLHCVTYPLGFKVYKALKVILNLSN